MKRKVLGLAFILCTFIIFAASVNAEDVTQDYAETIIASGKCGGYNLNSYTYDPVYFTLYNDGKMIIYGNGNMDSYMDDETAVPWYSYRNSIKSLIVEAGVTNVGTDTFSECANLSSVVLSDDVASIGFGAFYGCTSLKYIKISSTLKEILPSAFCGCTNITEIELPQSVQSIWHSAFLNCTHLKDVYYNGSEEQWQEISIEKGENDNLLNANIHYNSTLPEISPQITSATAVKNGNAYSFNVQMSDVTADCQLVIVIYSGDKVVNVKTTELKANDTSKLITIADDNATNAKVFIWNSLSGMRPLCEAKELDI